MKKLLFILLFIPFLLRGASPSFSDFNPFQFNTDSNKVSIISPITGPVLELVNTNHGVDINTNTVGQMWLSINDNWLIDFIGGSGTGGGSTTNMPFITNAPTRGQYLIATSPTRAAWTNLQGSASSLTNYSDKRLAILSDTYGALPRTWVDNLSNNDPYFADFQRTNIGVNGLTTAQIIPFVRSITNWSKKVQLFQQHYVYTYIGYADFLNGVPANTLINNLTTIWRDITNVGAVPIVSTLSGRSGEVSSLDIYINLWIRTNYTAFGAILLDVGRIIDPTQGMVLSDGLSPNDLGNVYLTRNFSLAVKQSQFALSQQSVGLGGYYIGPQSFSSLSIGRKGAEDIFVSPNGNIGIGTKTPSVKLTVNGDISAANITGNTIRALNGFVGPVDSSNVVGVILPTNLATNTPSSNDLLTATSSTTAAWKKGVIDPSNVKYYGAIGDGVTDDTIAIQTALNTQGTVFIPAGRYKVTSLILTNNFQEVRGVGRDQTYLEVSGINITGLDITATKKVHLIDFTIENGNVFGLGTGNAGIGIRISNSCSESTFERLSIRSFQGTPGIGLYVLGNPITTYDLNILNCETLDNKIGASFYGSIANIFIANSRFILNRQIQLRLDGSTNSSMGMISMSDSDVRCNTGSAAYINDINAIGIYADNVKPLMLKNTYTESSHHSSDLVMVLQNGTIGEVNGFYADGNNVASNGISVIDPARLTLRNGVMRNFIGTALYPTAAVIDTDKVEAPGIPISPYFRSLPIFADGLLITNRLAGSDALSLSSGILGSIISNNFGQIIIHPFSGSIQIGGSTYEPATRFYLYSGSTLKTRIDTDGTSFFNGGQFGLGQISPWARFTINGTNSMPSLSPYTYATASIGTGTNGAELNIGTYDLLSSNIWMQSKATSNNVPVDISINPLGGNVAIGLTNATAKLEVAGSVKVSGDLTISNNLIVNGNFVANSIISTTNYTYANLPSSPVLGQTVWCTDVITSYGVGDRVIWNGTNWFTMDKVVATTDIKQFILNCWKAGFTAKTPLTTAHFSKYMALPTNLDFPVNGNNVNNSISLIIAAPASGSVGGLGVGGTPDSATTVAGPTMPGVPGWYYGNFIQASVDALADVNAVYWAIVGFGVGGTSTNYPVNGVFFLYDPFVVNGHPITGPATNNWIAVTANASSYTYTDTGLPVSTSSSNPNRLGVIFTTTESYFYTNGVQSVFKNTAIPSNGENPYTCKIYRKSGAVGTRYLQIQTPAWHIRGATNMVWP